MTKLVKISDKMTGYQLMEEIKKYRKKYKEVHMKSKGLQRYIEMSGKLK